MNPSPSTVEAERGIAIKEIGDKDAPRILAELEKTETTDEAKRYAYAAKAGIATAENKAKFWNTTPIPR